MEPHTPNVVLLRKAVLKLVPVLLEMAGDEFGNHGCNDFDFSEHGLSEGEMKAFVAFMHEKNRDPEETEDAIKRLPNGSDFCVMFACATWMEELAKDEGIGEAREKNPTKVQRARLDENATAKPKTEIVGIFPEGKNNAASLMVRDTKPVPCSLPPVGWKCTRGWHAEGPCAAVPDLGWTDDEARRYGEIPANLCEPEPRTNDAVPRCEECNIEGGPKGELLCTFLSEGRWRCYDQSACFRRQTNRESRPSDPMAEAKAFQERHIECSQGVTSGGLYAVYKHDSKCKHPDEHSGPRIAPRSNDALGAGLVQARLLLRKAFDQEDAGAMLRLVCQAQQAIAPLMFDTRTDNPMLPHPGAGGGDDNDVRAAWDEAIARSLKACQVIEQECAALVSDRETTPVYYERNGVQRCIDAIKDLAEEFKEPDALKAEIEAELTDLRRVYRAAEALVKRLEEDGIECAPNDVLKTTLKMAEETKR